MRRYSARLLIGLIVSWLGLLMPAAHAENLRVYIGTYTDNGSEGIYVCDLDLATGALSEPRVAAKADNPSFLAFHPAGKFLYAVSEVADFDDSKGGAVSAFAIDAATGSLTHLNSQSSKGAGPCQLSVDHQGRCVLTANYGGGSVAGLPIADDGSLEPASAFVQHEGSSANKQRQSAPHTHSITVSPDDAFALAVDLGTDTVASYALTFAPAGAGERSVRLEKAVETKVSPGAGPRHLAFHPNGRWAYVINELDNTVSAFEYDPETGKLEPFQTATTLPEAFNGENWTAEIVVHPSGKFLYGSNRGHDSITIFAVDEQNGKLTSLGTHPTGGKTPRNFNVDPTGKWLLVANQDSGTVVVQQIDEQTGKLATTEHSVSVPSPACVKLQRQ
jgi:6-phosphogluconolactonase